MKYFLSLRPRNWLTNHAAPASTLIALSIALAIIVFLAALSMPLISTLAHQTVAAHAQALRTALWHAQQLAIVTNNKIPIVFDEAHGQYSYGAEFHKLASCVKFGILPHVLGPPSSPSKKLDKAITFESNSAYCYPQGTISPGTAYLVDESHQVLYAITVPIAGVSYIRMYRYTHQDGWKVCS